MKRFLILAILFLIVLGGIKFKMLVSENKLLNSNFESTNEMEKELNEYKKEKLDEKKRLLELTLLQRPEIVLSELKTVGRLIVYEGKINYSNRLSEKSFWSSKSLLADLNYKFGMSMDLGKVKVKSFHEKNVIIQIPSNPIKLEYLEYNPNNSDMISEKSWLAKQYDPVDVDIILEDSKKKCEEEINNDRYIYGRAKSNAKKQIKSIILELGFDNVIIVEEEVDHDEL